MVPILLLAAGASSRMAPADKLLQPVDGMPLLRRSALAALASGAPVVCTLRPDRPARRAAVADLPLTLVEVPDSATGMSASLRAGLAALPAGAEGVMVLPADMPGFTAHALAQLLALAREAPDRILRGATPDGRPGHPAVFPADLIPGLLRITGDEGGRSVLRAHAGRVILVPLPGDSAILDLDTAEDWAAFRRSRGE